MKEMTTLQADFMASHLRKQGATLQSILEAFETSNGVEDDYVEESFKRVVKDINRIRKVYNSSN